MNGIRFQAKTQQDGFYAEYFLEIGNDGYASPTACGYGLSAKGVLNCLAGSSIGRSVDGSNITVSALKTFYLYRNCFWCQRREIVLEKPVDFTGSWFGTSLIDIFAKAFEGRMVLAPSPV